LRRRLIKRGVALSGVALLALVANSVTAGGPSSNLIQATLTAAAGQPSPAVAALLHGSSFAMFTGKIRLLTAALLLIGFLATAGVLHSRWPSEPPPSPPQRSATAPAREPAPPVADKADPNPADVFTYSGRVLDPDGKPLAGAKIYITGLTSGIIEFKPRTTTAADGTFRFTVKRDEFKLRGDEQPGSRVTIGATAPRCGGAVAWASKADDREKLTLWLPQEQVVTGRILDLEGKPVAGVHVGYAIRGALWDLDGRPVPFDHPIDKTRATSNILPDDPDLAAVVSDKEGRFTIRGLGKDWLYDLWFSGPTIEHRKAQLVTRPQEPKKVQGAGVWTRERGEPKLIQYGSDFTHVAAPSKPIIGVVRDKDTGKPIAGARVGKQWTRDDEPSGWTTTDADGKYRLEGLPWAVHELTVEPPKDAPYLRTTARAVADKPGTEPATCDIDLLRQRLVTGHVTNRATGKPVTGWIEYRPLADNPNLKFAPHLAEPRWPPQQVMVQIDKEGRFSIPTLPGRGVLVVKAEGTFLPAQLAEGDHKPGLLDAKDAELLDTRPHPFWVSQFHAYRVVDVPAEDMTCDLTVDPGRSLSLTVLAPDGKPCAARALGIDPQPFDQTRDVPDGRGTIRAFAEGERRRLFLQSTDDKFAGVIVLTGKETDAVKVQLQPTGVITGRLVDADGKPLAGRSFQIVYDDGDGRPGVYFGGGGFSYRFATAAETKRQQRTSGILSPDKREYLVGSEKTDEQGRFRIAGVFPEVAFDLKVMLTRPNDNPKQKGEIIVGMVKVARPTVKAGEALDLGDLTVDKTASK
jgi:protocatechuate 3,4-dioxygenase beta subunit